jgi:hypothetical protein
MTLVYKLINVTIILKKYIAGRQVGMRNGKKRGRFIQTASYIIIQNIIE